MQAERDKMPANFQTIIDTLPSLLDRLKKSPALLRDELQNIPQKGIYVFYEKGKPIYVGRSKSMKNRLKQHMMQKSAGHNSASFAFNIAKRDAHKKGVNIRKWRAELEKNEIFKQLFSQAKERVSHMRVRCVAISDPNMQAIFEIYASLALKTTKYNTFDTH